MYLKPEIKSYLKYLNIKNYSYKTIERRRTTLTKYANEYTSLDLCSINQFYHEIKQFRSVNAYLSDLKNFIKYLEGQEKIPVGLSAKIDFQKKRKTLPKIIYSPEELKWTIDAIPETSEEKIRHKALFYLLYGTGLRIGEGLSLKVYDLNFTEKKLHVRKGKGAKDRVIPLPKSVADYLNDYLQLKSKYSDYVFSHYGKKLNQDNTSAVIKEYFPEGFTAHSFRHHIAVHLLEKGLSVRYIQAFLGHEDIKTTTIYTHVVRQRLNEAYRKTHPLQILEDTDET